MGTAAFPSDRKILTATEIHSLTIPMAMELPNNATDDDSDGILTRNELDTDGDGI